MTNGAILHTDAILDDLQGQDGVTVFTELCAPLARAEGVALEELVASLVEREALASTAVGHGVAMPHGIHPGLRRVVASFGRSRTGIDFAAPDGAPVKLFVALIRPPDAAAAHLKALARYSQLLVNASVREALLAAPSAEDIRRILGEHASAR